MKRYKKTQILHFFCQKFWLMKLIINNVQKITKSDQAIEIETTTYCNVSPKIHAKNNV